VPAVIDDSLLKPFTEVILKVFEKKIASYVLFINKEFLCTLFRFIFIDLQNVGVISAAPCILSLNVIHTIKIIWNTQAVNITFSRAPKAN